MALYEPLPCPDCGVEKIDRHLDEHGKFFVQCSCCGRHGLHEDSGITAITSWNNLPRMSTIIAWQFQAAGLALENQILNKMVDWLVKFAISDPFLTWTPRMEETIEKLKEAARLAVEGK